MTLDEALAAIDAVSAGDVQRVAASLIHDDGLPARGGGVRLATCAASTATCSSRLMTMPTDRGDRSHDRPATGPAPPAHSGALALARAELETLAGRDALDDDGLADLAEVRWRTGDLAGAGEAAAVDPREDGDDGPLIALIVAAEAAMARGRPPRHVGTPTWRWLGPAGPSTSSSPGMPRGQVWPADPPRRRSPLPTLFDMPAVGPVAADEAARPRATRPRRRRATMAAETTGPVVRRRGRRDAGVRRRRCPSCQSPTTSCCSPARR